MGELYEYIDKWDDISIFTYITIFLSVLWFFRKKELGVNILIAIIIGWFIINYLNHRSITTIDTKEKNEAIKKEKIVPELTDEAQSHIDIVDLLFSIQDMYIYNPQQYEKMVQSINYFYDLYKITYVDNKTSYLNYDMMKQFKRDALNALMSLIYTLPEDKHIRNKVNSAAIVLDNILTKYLDQISYILDDYTYKNGYSVDTKIIDYGVKPMNEYDDIFKIYSYDIY